VLELALQIPLVLALLFGAVQLARVFYVYHTLQKALRGVAGVAPRIMGFGPVPAAKKALERAGLELKDMDVIEINEAFAAQVLGCLKGFGVAFDDSRVNPNGGAIAVGHPLGASGARLALTAARQLQRSGGRYALVSMCIGVGQGIAVVLERV
jgi:acetyl-CoA C-acetyltransferase